MSSPTPLKRAIFESTWTQRALAAEVGLREDQLSRITHGLHCDAPTQARIATALGLPVATLWPSAGDDDESRAA